MKYSKYVIALSIMFLFTGCFTTNVNFQQSFVDGVSQHNLKKVENTKIVIEPKADNFVIKRPNGYIGSATKINVNMASINNLTLEYFFKQYFKNVEISNKIGDINISSDLINYQYRYPLQSLPIISVKVKFIVKKQNKEILNKIYEISSEDSIIFISKGIFVTDFIEEPFNKILFELYETKFKPDLLKALKENM